MRIIVFLLFVLFVSSPVLGEESEFAPENFGDLFRNGLGSLRDLFPGNSNDNGVDDNNGGSNASDDSNFRNFCNCRLGARSRIIGGKEAPKDWIPWHVSLGSRYSGRHLCGGKFFYLKYL